MGKTAASLIAAFSWAFGILSMAHGADVHGKVTLANGANAKFAVVWLTGNFHSKPMKGVVVDQRDLTFIPHVTVVTIGTKVNFPNNDTVYHNIFAEFDAKRFDLGMYPRGATRSITFDKPGIVAMLCSVHSEMSAYVMVVDTPYAVVADGQGKFKIGAVPSGDYTLHVWHESGQGYLKPLTIGANSTDIAIRTSRR